MQRELVKVRHGLPGMSERIPYREASRFVKRGMAKWTSEKQRKIVFLNSHQRDSAEAEALARQSQEDRYYNGSDVLTRKQVQHLPVLRPHKLMTVPTKVRTAVHRNGKVRTVVQDGVEMTVSTRRSSADSI